MASKILFRIFQLISVFDFGRISVWQTGLLFSYLLLGLVQRVQSNEADIITLLDYLYSTFAGALAATAYACRRKWSVFAAKKFLLW